MKYLKTIVACLLFFLAAGTYDLAAQNLVTKAEAITILTSEMENVSEMADASMANHLTAELSKFIIRELQGTNDVTAAVNASFTSYDAIWANSPNVGNNLTLAKERIQAILTEG